MNLVQRFYLPAVLLTAMVGIAILSNCSLQSNNIDETAKLITVETYTDHIKTLSSDEFGGRQPASPGEEKTLAYLTKQFTDLGLTPGNGDSFLQPVPLVSITTTPEDFLKVSGVGRGFSLKFGSDYVAANRHVVESVDVKNSQFVFAGYGIVAPEYGWNDYEGIDVKGKTVLVLVNDPGFATQNDDLFTGKAMTYYGRWTYKFEEAARQGAAGVLVIHEMASAGYPWWVVGGSRISPNFYLESPDKNMSRCALEGWISYKGAVGLMAYAGLDYETEKSAAAKQGYRAKPLGVVYSTTLKNEIKHLSSNNVLAKLPGAVRPDEFIIYSAHWDHLGTSSSGEGDLIYNGARDNATGTAALMEMARAFVNLPVRPDRSILFLAVTAEEQGLLGSAYYAANPVYPTNRTVAAINMDAMNIVGQMKDITIVGKGKSELDAYLEAVAAAEGRYVRPDPEPEKGIFYRSDHFSFAKHGIPSLYAKMGIEHVEHGSEWTNSLNDAWTREHYHKVSDEYDPETWDLRGAVDDMRLLFKVGYRLSMETKFPNWYAGNEFRAIRDADMGAE